MLISSLLFGISASLDALLVGISYGIRQIRIRFWQNLIISLITLLGTCLSVGLGHKLIPFLPAPIQGCAGSLILILLGLYYIVKWVITSLQNCCPKAPPEAAQPPEITSTSVKGTASARDYSSLIEASPIRNSSPAEDTFSSREASPIRNSSSAMDSFSSRKTSSAKDSFSSRETSSMRNTSSSKAASSSKESLPTKIDSSTRDASAAKNPHSQLKLAEVFALSLTLSLNNLSAGLSASLAGLTLLPTAVSTLVCSILFLFSGNRLGQNPVLQLAGRAADPLSGALLIGLGLVQFFI